ncbi:MAG: Sec-independent protein translocase protein TatB [Sutterellaceae bacterium]|nr:Sec-independent protein translocase protein TatB [Burkholderiaceae bacterium]MDW8430586.1 Sec-independent protein translocase protein TatB [Sutterellaceae bacterium]
MFDFSLGELGLIGVVALVVLGPERLPRVARTVGEWLGKAQRYVNQVKADIHREMELAELKRLQEEARAAAQSLQSSVQELQGELHRTASELSMPLATPADEGSSSTATATDYAFEGAGDSWGRRTFPRRYKLGPSVDELAEELARLKRQLALPDAYTATRRKYAPRARINRPRIRR